MNYPGLGQLIFDALMREDQYVVMAGVVMGVVMLVIGNLLADLLLAEAIRAFVWKALLPQQQPYYFRA